MRGRAAVMQASPGMEEELMAFGAFWRVSAHRVLCFRDSDFQHLGDVIDFRWRDFALLIGRKTVQCNCAKANDYDENQDDLHSDPR